MVRRIDFRRILGAACAVLLACALPAAGRSTRRAHRAKRAAPPTPLLSGRWTGENRRAIEELVARLGNTAPGYTDTRPPAAVLVLDDVSVVGNPGEAAFHRLVAKAEFKFNDKFWELIPSPRGQKARAGYKEFQGSPAAVWPQDPYYQMYRKEFFGAYRDLCDRWGRKTCAAWLVKLLSGFDEAEAQATMRRSIDEALRAPVGWETVQESPDDELSVKIRTGLRPIPEMEALCRLLCARGFDVWVLSSSNIWAAQALAARYGVDPSRVIGVRGEARNGVLGTGVAGPVPVGGGVLEAIAQLLGRAPDLSVGGAADVDFLAYGSGLRLAIDPGDAGLRKEARRRGWLLQPAFAPDGSGEPDSSR